MSRRKPWIFAIAAIFIFTAFVETNDVFAAKKGPIRIGLIMAKTGILAGQGKDQNTSLQIHTKLFGKKIAGRPVEFFVEDNQSNVAQTVTKVRKLITRDKVHIIMGGLLAPTGYAIAPLADQYKTPMLIWTCPDDLSQRKRKKFVVKYFSCSQAAHALGHWTRISMPNVKRVITFALDAAFGYEAVGGFQKVFEDNGGQVVQKIYMPFTTVDYGPYISKLRKDADAIYVVMGGPQVTRIPKQFKEAGVSDRYVILGAGTGTDEFSLHAIGDEILGWTTTLTYSPDYQTAANKKYVNAFKKTANKYPGYYAEGYYGALRVMYEAIASINGDVENKDKLLGAMKKVKATTLPSGPKQSDGYGNLNSNVFIRTVVKDSKGVKYNKTLKIYENVSQFWTYKPEEFLKQPVYSRDYPPCKYCGK